MRYARFTVQYYKCALFSPFAARSVISIIAGILMNLDHVITSGRCALELDWTVFKQTLILKYEINIKYTVLLGSKGGLIIEVSLYFKFIITYYRQK